MNKRILFIGYNFSPELTGIGKYSGEMMDWLANKGYKCTVLTAYPYYPQWRVQPPYRKNRFGYKRETEEYDSGGVLRVIRCPMYIPGKPSGLKRMLLDLSFSATVLGILTPLMFSRKYDWVISVAPSFQFGLLGVLYKRLRGTKHLYHIQDLQIEAAQDLGLINSGTLLKALYGVERYIFRHTDIVSSISEGMIHRIAKKAGKPVTFFPNWTDTTNFYPVSSKSQLKEHFGFKESDWVVLYSGAIGEKQGLDIILHAAKSLESVAEVKFIICGFGPYKEKLQEMADGMELDNLQFLPLQPKEEFNDFLNMADLHLVIQKAKASDLVMPSKLTTILSVGGLPLITADADTCLYNLVDKHQMGLLIPAEDQAAFNEALMSAYQNRHDGRYGQIRKAARSYADRFLSKEQIMQSFENHIR